MTVSLGLYMMDWRGIRRKDGKCAVAKLAYEDPDTNALAGRGALCGGCQQARFHLLNQHGYENEII